MTCISSLLHYIIWNASTTLLKCYCNFFCYSGGSATVENVGPSWFFWSNCSNAIIEGLQLCFMLLIPFHRHQIKRVHAVIAYMYQPHSLFKSTSLLSTFPYAMMCIWIIVLVVVVVIIIIINIVIIRSNIIVSVILTTHRPHIHNHRISITYTQAGIGLFFHGNSHRNHNYRITIVLGIIITLLCFIIRNKIIIRQLPLYNCHVDNFLWFSCQDLHFQHPSQGK